MPENPPIRPFVRATLERCFRPLRQTLPFDRAAVWWREGSLLYRQALTPEEAPLSALDAPLPANSLLYEVLSGAAPLLLDDARAAPRYRGELGDSASLLLAPLLLDGQPQGVLGLGRRAPSAFTEGDASLLAAIAPQIAAAVQTAQEYEALHANLVDSGHEAMQRAEQRAHEAKALRETRDDLTAQIQKLFALHEIGKSMQLLHEEAAIADYAVQAIVGQLGMERGMLLLLDPHSQQLTCRALADPQSLSHPVCSFPLESGLLGQTVRSAAPLFVADVRQESALEAGLWEQLPVTSLVALPIPIENRVQGVLLAGSHFPYSRLVEADVPFFALLAVQVGRALENAWIYSRTLRQVGETASLYAMGVAIASNLDLDEILRAIHHELGQVLDNSYFAVAFYDQYKSRLDFRLAYRAGQAMHRFGLALNEAETLEGCVLGQREPLLVEDLDAAPEPRLRAFQPEPGAMRCWLGVPVVLRDQTLGLLIVQSTKPYAFDKQHLWMLSAVANQMAIAIDNAQLYGELRKLNSRLEQRVQTRTAELATVNEIARTANATPDLQQPLARAMQLISQSFGVERASLLLLEETLQQLDLATNLGGDLRTLQLFALETGKGIAGWVARTGKEAIVQDVTHDPRFFPDLSQSRGLVVRSTLCVPLEVKGQLVGVLELLNKLSGEFRQEDADRLRTLVPPIALALENARLSSEAQRQASERLALYSAGKELRSLQALIDAPQEVFRRITEIIAGVSPHYHEVALYTLPEGLLTFQARHGREESVTPLAHADEGAVVEALSQGRSLLLEQARQRTDYTALAGSSVSAALLPLLDLNQQARGFLQVESADRLTPNDLDLLQAFAEQIAFALENVALYHELQEANSSLVRLNDARLEFVSSVSHELRTPMTAIKGYTDMLISGMTGPLSEPQLHFLKIIKSNADRMSTLVSDLLEVSRLEAGRVLLKLREVPVADVLQEVLLTLQGQISAKKLSLSTMLPPNLPPVWGDSDRIIQILTNLCGNACKYTPEGGSIQIVAALHSQPASNSQEPSHHYVRLDITDTGIGIASEEQAKVFQRFFRADHPLVREQTGTGLGLSIVKGLVELHGGCVWFVSELGAGSTFSVILPVSGEEPRAESPLHRGGRSA